MRVRCPKSLYYSQSAGQFETCHITDCGSIGLPPAADCTASTVSQLLSDAFTMTTVIRDCDKCQGSKQHHARLELNGTLPGVVVLEVDRRGFGKTTKMTPTVAELSVRIPLVESADGEQTVFKQYSLVSAIAVSDDQNTRRVYTRDDKRPTDRQWGSTLCPGPCSPGLRVEQCSREDVTHPHFHSRWRHEMLFYQQDPDSGTEPAPSTRVQAGDAPHAAGATQHVPSGGRADTRSTDPPHNRRSPMTGWSAEAAATGGGRGARLAQRPVPAQRNTSSQRHDHLRTDEVMLARSRNADSIRERFPEMRVSAAGSRDDDFRSSRRLSMDAQPRSPGRRHGDSLDFRRNDTTRGGPGAARDTPRVHSTSRGSAGARSPGRDSRRARSPPRSPLRPPRRRRSRSSERYYTHADARRLRSPERSFSPRTHDSRGPHRSWSVGNGRQHSVSVHSAVGHGRASSRDTHSRTRGRDNGASWSRARDDAYR